MFACPSWFKVPPRYPDACGEIAKMIEEDTKARMRK